MSPFSHRVFFVILALAHMVFGFPAARVAAQNEKGLNAVPVYGRMADGKQWTAANLNVPVAPSYCYEDVEQNCQIYGRLYTWESAQRGCQLFGKGWHLPTDDEWRQMANHYGGVREDPNLDGKAAYKALLIGGTSGFKGLLGGGRDQDGRSARLKAHGFYWTASETSKSSARFYNFGQGILALSHNSGEKERAFSVRCVRN